MTLLRGRLRAAFFIAAAALFASTGGVRAQGVMQQMGPSTAGHLIMGLGVKGQTLDAGGPTTANGPPKNNSLPGTLPTGLGIVNSGLGHCQWSVYASAPYSEFCWGFDGAGNPRITIDRVGGGPNPTMTWSLNGTVYQFPGPGNGNVLGPTSPAPTAGNLATWNGGTTQADSALPVAALGIFYSEYGVSATNTAPQNSAAQKAAATAAYNQGVSLNTCVAGATAVTIQTNGAPFYGGMHVIPCPATMYQMQQTGAAFYTLPTPASTAPGTSYGPLILDAGLHVDMNNNDGTALLIEGFGTTPMDTVITTGIGSGSWTYDDGTGHPGSYLDAAVTIKAICCGSPGTGGANYATLNAPFLRCSAGGEQGVGLLLTTTAGQTNPVPNVARVVGGTIHGCKYGEFIQAGNDFSSSADLSSNTYGSVVGDPTGFGVPSGDYNVTINRANFERPYLEGSVGLPEWAGVWFTSVSQLGNKEGDASVTASAACIDDGVIAGSHQCGSLNHEGVPFTPQLLTASAGIYSPSSVEAGVFELEMSGPGGPGGGCVASDSTHNCIGGGGGGGGMIKAICRDPLLMNFAGASYAAGVPGTPGTGAGGSDGTPTTFTGNIQPFSGGGTWTLPDWVALTAYTAKSFSTATSFILPTVGNAGSFEFAATVSGTTGAGPVTWPQVPGQTVTSGTATFENIGPSAWSAGMTAFVDSTTRLGTLLGPASSGNAGLVFYMAVQPGITGGGAPTWKQRLLSATPDGGVLWLAVATSISLSAAPGAGGATGGFNTTSMDLQPAGVIGANATSTCSREYTALPAYGGNASFNITNGFGHTGGGGSNLWGRGGVSIPILNTSTQSVGSAGTGFGAAGGGAVSAINNSGADKNGGAGVAGAILVKSWAAAQP